MERRSQLLLCRALGARVWDIAQLHLVEIGVLASGAALLSFLIGNGLLAVILGVLPESMQFGGPPAISWRTIIVASLLTLVSVLLVSIWPLFVASRFGSSTIGRNARVGPNAIAGTRLRSGGAVIAVQAACGFMFVIAGVLTVASLGAALSNDAGYERDRMILLEGAVRRYVSSDDARQQIEDSVALLKRMPGVEAVAVSTLQSTLLRPQAIPTPVVPEGWSREADQAIVRMVSENFFEVMGLRLAEGRWPDRGGWTGGSVALVSAEAARTYWPDGRAIGRALTVAPVKSPRTVVGVVADARFAGLDVAPTQDVYVPDPVSRGRTSLLFHVRAADSAEALLPVIIRDLSATGLRVDRATTHSRGLFDSIKDRALPAWLFGSLASGALLVLAIGIGGLLAMSSAQRTREIGIRLALGSTRIQVVKVMLVEPLTAVLDGLVIGAVASWWLVTFLDSQLYGVGSHQPSLWMAAAILIALVACAAGGVPAIRAARLNPVAAIRED
jgi:hypothetical protein